MLFLAIALVKCKQSLLRTVRQLLLRPSLTKGSDPRSACVRCDRVDSVKAKWKVCTERVSAKKCVYEVSTSKIPSSPKISALFGTVCFPKGPPLHKWSAIFGSLGKSVKRVDRLKTSDVNWMKLMA